MPVYYGHDEGGEVDPEAVQELRQAIYLSLRATKGTSREVGRSMTAMVAMERHLKLSLSGMEDKARAFLLDTPGTPAGLFGDTMQSVVEKFQEVKKQSAAFQWYLPRRFQG